MLFNKLVEYAVSQQLVFTANKGINLADYYCTDKQLSYIASKNGKVITVIPETWGEISDFKNKLRKESKKKKVIMRRRLDVNGKKYNTYSCFEGTYKTKKGVYTIYWILSSEKKVQDFRRRQALLEQSEKELEELSFKLNKRNLKTKTSIIDRVDKLLDKYKVKRFYQIKITERKINYKVQDGKGRPGPNTKYKTEVEKKYYLSWEIGRASCRERV